MLSEYCIRMRFTVKNKLPQHIVGTLENQYIAVKIQAYFKVYPHWRIDFLDWTNLSKSTRSARGDLVNRVATSGMDISASNLRTSGQLRHLADLWCPRVPSWKLCVVISLIKYTSGDFTFASNNLQTGISPSENYGAFRKLHSNRPNYLGICITAANSPCEHDFTQNRHRLTSLFYTRNETFRKYGAGKCPS